MRNLSPLRSPIHQIDQRFIRHAAVYRQTDFAGAAVGETFGCIADAVFKWRKRRIVQFGIEKSAVACPSTAIDIIGDDYFFGTKLSDGFQLFFEVHFCRAARGVNGDGDGLFLKGQFI